MPPLMNRLAELLGPDLAQRLADEFAGQVIYFRMKDAHALRDQIRRNGEAIKQWSRDELRNSGRVVDRGNGFLVLEHTAEEGAAIDAAILAEFSGVNHVQLAHDYRVSIQWVYRLVMQAHDEITSALPAASIYMPEPSPFANETPEERRARHYRRYLQVAAGNIEAPLEIPGQPAADPDAEVPPPGASE